MADKFDRRSLVLRQRRYWALEVHLEYDRNPNNPYPVFLVTHDMDHPQYNASIQISRRKAKQLYDWLTVYLASYPEE